MLSTTLLASLLLPFWYTYVQAQVPCDQCADAAVCFRNGPCAACDASPEACTGACEGCGAAEPCRPCFQTEEPFPWPVQTAELPCDYSIDKAAVTMLRGEIPAWLSGTLYHAQHTNASHMDYSGNLATPSGILSIDFDGSNESPPKVSFDMARGGDWQQTCGGTLSPPYISDCVVTVNQFAGTLASVCVSGDLAQFETDDLGGVNFAGSLALTWNDPEAEDTWPYGQECEGFCPPNLQPEHMPIDANGDVYSLYYTMEPVAGYRVFKVPKGTTERVELAWVESVRDTPSYTHMGPVPTNNYLIIVEPPMPLDVTYDWAGYYANFDADSPVTVYVLDKSGESGDVIAQYTIEGDSFWTWHAVNAWEDCETGEVMLDITRDPNASSFKSFYNSTPGDFAELTLARVTLSNPRTAGMNGGVATITILDTAGLAIEFPVTQDQYQFAGKTGHYWMAGAKPEEADTKAFPLSMVAIVKHDVERGVGTHVWEPEGLSPGEPYFVPKAQDQGAMNDEGAIVVVALNSTGHLFGAVLDATNLEEFALFEIPMAPVPSIGLHNFYSTSSTWTSTPISCDDNETSPTDDMTSSTNGATSTGTGAVPGRVAASALAVTVFSLFLMA